MGTETNISYVRRSFNPWLGCEKKSPGCDNCFACAWAKRAGMPELWEGVRQRTKPATWKKPLTWNTQAADEGVRHRVLCGTLCDVFDKAALARWRLDLWNLIHQTPNLDWLLLTKSPENWDFLLPEAMPRRFANIQIGTTIENRECLEARMPFVSRAHALGWPTWISAEPMLEPLDFGESIRDVGWMVMGGESIGARHFDLDGARDLIGHCNDNGVPAYTKQLGRAWARQAGAKNRDGADPAEWPEDLRVRQFPEVVVG